MRAPDILSRFRLNRPLGVALWSLLILLGVALAASGLRSPHWLNSNLLAMLPQDTVPAAARQASDRYRQTLSSKTLWLTPGGSPADAARHTKRLRQTLNDSALFQEIGPTFSEQELQQRYRQLAPYRYQLLTPADRQAALSQPDALIQRALARLYRPSGASSQQWQADPLFLFERYLASLSRNNAELHNGIAILSHNDRYWGMSLASTRHDSFAIDQQKQLSAFHHQIQQDFPGTLFTGIPFYAAAGAVSAEQEIRTVGLFSLICIVLLFVLIFASLRPLLLALVSIASGILWGLAASLWLFGDLHLLALVFGASLIGVSVDYSIHYFCHLRGQPDASPTLVRNRLLAPLGLALLSSVLGYSAMAWAQFPGLQQVAVFSISGLIMAWLTVMLLFPALSRQPGTTLASWVPRLHLAMSHWQRLVLRFRWPALLIGAAIVAGMLRLTPSDNVHDYQTPPAHLQIMQEQLAQITGNAPGAYFVVHGRDMQHWWQREQQLHDALEAAHIDNEALSSYWTPAQQQRTTHAALAEGIFQHSRFARFSDTVGMTDAARQKVQADFDQPVTPLSLPDWLQRLNNPALSQLWHGCDNEGCRSLVLVRGNVGASHETPLTTFNAPDQGITLIDDASSISRLMGSLRDHLHLLLIAAYALSATLLTLARGPMFALRLLAVPALASLVVLGTLGWLTGHYGLIHVLALFLILGIGIDYAIFYQQDGHTPTATLAVLFSATTTSLSFGLLGLSDTQVVHDFGFSVFVGIVAAALLAPLFTASSPPLSPSTENGFSHDRH